MSNRIDNEVQRVVILGGGSAGFLAALTFRRLLPHLQVTVVHSLQIPVIGVGESTTPAVPIFLHDTLGIDRDEFFRSVKPSWKLGLRLEWGDPEETHFNYPFDSILDKQLKGLPKCNAFYCLVDRTDSGLFGALMDRDLSPAIVQAGRVMVDQRTAYHVENEAFVDFLQRTAQQRGATLIEGSVVEVLRTETGDVRSLRLEDGQEIEADLFVDCSGFPSLLMGQALSEPWVSYDDALFCDRAVIGSWQRSSPGDGSASDGAPDDDVVKPYTTVETMDNGWCWRIDFLDKVARGYVYSSAFCSDEEATQEIKRKNPKLGDDLRILKFNTGRYERFWTRNVAAIGNASGFVEPLEATALHLITEQLSYLVQALGDCDCRPTPPIQELENERFRRVWDDVRDFLAVHYRFNRKLDTPFWRHCRETTPLGGAEALVEHYAAAGPTRLTMRLMEPGSIFGYAGYMAVLVGQRVPTDARRDLSSEEAKIWTAHQESIARTVKQALPMREALKGAYAASTPKK